MKEFNCELIVFNCLICKKKKKKKKDILQLSSVYRKQYQICINWYSKFQYLIVDWYQNRKSGAIVPYLIVWKATELFFLLILNNGINWEYSILRSLLMGYLVFFKAIKFWHVKSNVFAIVVYLRPFPFVRCNFVIHSSFLGLPHFFHPVLDCSHVSHPSSLSLYHPLFPSFTDVFFASLRKMYW